MELVKIKGVQKNKPAREECKNMLTMADIIEGVNAVLNPGKPKINWFAPADDAVAAVHIKDGKYDEATSNPSVVYGGKVSDNKVENLKVVAYEGTEGAIYAEGAGTDVTVDTAYISLAGDGQGIGGPASGASAKYNAKLTIKNAVIDTNGRTRYATAAVEIHVLTVRCPIPPVTSTIQKSSVMDGQLCPQSLPKAMYTWKQMTVILFVPRAVTVHTPIRDATITSMTVTLICPVWQPLLQEIPI